jgi:hypothetical protein
MKRFEVVLNPGAMAAEPPGRTVTIGELMGMQDELHQGRRPDQAEGLRALVAEQAAETCVREDWLAPEPIVQRDVEYDRAFTLYRAKLGRRIVPKPHGITITDEKGEEDFSAQVVIRLHGAYVGTMSKDLLGMEARHLIETSLDSAFARVKADMGGGR